MLMNTKCKLLIITTSKFELDGITNVILNYYLAMDKSDIVIDLLTPNIINKKLQAIFLSNNSNLYTLNGRNSHPIKYMWQLHKIVKKNKYDIIHVHGNSCTLALEMLAGLIGGVKTRIAHSHNTTTKHPFLNTLLRPFFNLLITDGFACGEAAGKWLFKYRSFEIINNGINIEKFQFNYSVREKMRNTYKINNEKIICHVGNFNYQKNHLFLIEIFNELIKLNNQYRLVLIGDGDLKSTIEDKVNSLGLKEFVIFIGKSNNVQDFLQMADIFILPSHFEGFPLVLLEAQAACLPCFISSNISKEVKITSLIKTINSCDSALKWALKVNSQELLNREVISEININNLVSSGYDINENAKTMKKFYFNYLK
jgi:glycosyltransferase involved in cell wall biosynthesis